MLEPWVTAVIEEHSLRDSQQLRGYTPKSDTLSQEDRGQKPTTYNREADETEPTAF